MSERDLEDKEEVDKEGNTGRRRRRRRREQVQRER